MDNHETAKLEEGQEVIISIPFAYSIGDMSNHFSGKTLETIDDCKEECKMDISAMEGWDTCFGNIEVE